MKIFSNSSRRIAISSSWDDIIKALLGHGYEVDSAYRRNPDNFIIAYKDGQEYEIEVTRYRNGDYEILSDNIARVSDITAAYRNDYLFEDDDPYDDAYINYNSDDDDDGDDEYVKVNSKYVLDSDGFQTEYAMYMYTGDDPARSKFIFMFGDSDLYGPDEDYADWTCDSREEAIQWFASYTGFEDEDDEIYSNTEVDSRYWYFTTHGVQPGSVPKGYDILEIVDKPEGSYFLTDRVIPYDSLVEYDIKEKIPEDDLEV